MGDLCCCCCVVVVVVVVDTRRTEYPPPARLAAPIPSPQGDFDGEGAGEDD